MNPEGKDPTCDDNDTPPQEVLKETVDPLERAMIHLTNADEASDVITSHNSVNDDGSLFNPTNPNGPGYDPRVARQESEERAQKGPLPIL